MRTLVTSSGRGQESDLVVDGGQRGAGDLARPGSPAGEDPVELRRIVQIGVYPFGKRSSELRHHLGEILLQVAVAAPGVLRLQVRDLAVGERRVDRQQVADAR